MPFSSHSPFRLAPADYHRFHTLFNGEVGKINHISGQYYTGSSYFFSEESTGSPVAFVAIGALLVGSIRWTAGGQEGQKVARGARGS